MPEVAELEGLSDSRSGSPLNLASSELDLVTKATEPLSDALAMVALNLDRSVPDGAARTTEALQV